MFDGEVCDVKNLVLSDLVFESDLIFGCTGSKVKGVERSLFSAKSKVKRRLADKGSEGLGRFRLGKFFVSCSSGDREFRPLIDLLVKLDNRFIDDPFVNASGHIGEFRVTLLNGGFPANFDRENEREPKERILLTRELSYACFIQAKCMLKHNYTVPENIMMDVHLQQSVVYNWIKRLFAVNGEVYRGYLSQDEKRRYSFQYSPHYEYSGWAKVSEGEDLRLKININDVFE